MFEGLPSAEEIAMDADVLMNLVATGRLATILETLGIRPVIAPAVEAEVLYLCGEGPDDPIEAVDVAGLITTGMLERASITTDEADLYVELAAEVDDGEAQAIALASRRGLCMASDDRRAARAATRRDVKVVTTPELLERWERLSAMREGVGDCLRLIERRAHYRPGRNHGLGSWWRERSQEVVEDSA